MAFLLLNPMQIQWNCVKYYLFSRFHVPSNTWPYRLMSLHDMWEQVPFTSHHAQSIDTCHNSLTACLQAIPGTGHASNCSLPANGWVLSFLPGINEVLLATWMRAGSPTINLAIWVNHGFVGQSGVIKIPCPLSMMIFGLLNPRGLIEGKCIILSHSPSLEKSPLYYVILHIVFQVMKIELMTLIYYQIAHIKPRTDELCIRRASVY